MGSDLNTVIPDFTTAGKKTDGDNFFYFLDSFDVQSFGFAIFINKSGNKFFPVVTDPIKFYFFKNLNLYKTSKVTNCGIHSYLLELLKKNKKRFYLDCVFFMFHEETRLTFSNLIIKNIKTQKIDDISNLFILSDDAALIACLTDVPIYVDDNSINHLTYVIPQGMDTETLISFIRSVLGGDVKI